MTKRQQSWFMAALMILLMVWWVFSWPIFSYVDRHGWLDFLFAWDHTK